MNSFELIHKFKSHMSVEFEMTYLGEFHHFLGIKVWKKEDCICMSQARYTWDILKFKMKSCKTDATPLEIGLKKNKNDDSILVDKILYH